MPGENLREDLPEGLLVSYFLGFSLNPVVNYGFGKFVNKTTFAKNLGYRKPSLIPNAN
jgi:hypothetical protein